MDKGVGGQRLPKEQGAPDAGQLAWGRRAHIRWTCVRMDLSLC